MYDFMFYAFTCHTGLIKYAAVACYNSDMVSDVREACRISRLAMSTIKNDRQLTSELSVSCYHYYAFVAPLSEPLQSCSDNLRRGFEVGMACGDPPSSKIYFVAWLQLNTPPPLYP